MSAPVVRIDPTLLPRCAERLPMLLCELENFQSSIDTGEHISLSRCEAVERAFLSILDELSPIMRAVTAKAYRYAEVTKHGGTA